LKSFVENAKDARFNGKKLTKKKFNIKAKMAAHIEFDQELLRKFVIACEELGSLERNNVSSDQLLIMRLRVICALVDAIPNLTLEEQTNMILALLRMEQKQQEEQEHTDPTPTQEEPSN